MNRKELDAFVAHHGLSRAAVELSLSLAEAKPSAVATREFVLRMLRLAGLLSIAAGVIFFIAANWQDLYVVGRFALVQLLLVGGIAAAVWQPPPSSLGRSGLLAAFIMTGALLALFGQTYQTGADIYELFLAWTLLGLLFVIAANWSVLWGAWVLVLNVALALFCGLRPQGGLLWALLVWGLPISQLLLVPVAVNLALWAFCESSQTWVAASRWLRRFIVACALLIATWSGCFAILGTDFDSSSSRGEDAVALLMVVLVLAGVGVHTSRRRADVFPLTLVAGSIIVLGTCALINAIEIESAGAIFMVAAWLIASSTIAGRLLNSRVRAWRGNESAA